MKKKIPIVIQEAMRRYPSRPNLYPKRYVPEKGLDEWLYFNPWTDERKNYAKKIRVVWHYTFNLDGER